MLKKIISWFLGGIGVCIVCVISYGLFGPVYSPKNCEAYEREPKVDGIKFSGADEATRIAIVPPDELNLNPIIITDPEKIELAKQTIQKYPNGWVEFHYTKWNLLEITAATPIEFYDNNNRLLDSFKVRQDILVYRTKGQIYWRCIEVKELHTLIEALNIPDQILTYP
jgi:hypothetical protein